MDGPASLGVRVSHLQRAEEAAEALLLDHTHLAGAADRGEAAEKEPPVSFFALLGMRSAAPRTGARAERQVQRIGGNRSAHMDRANAFSSVLSRKPFSRSATSSNGDARKRPLHLYLVQ